MTLTAQKIKPSERVVAYLHRELNLADQKEMFRLPSFREISEKTGVSISTARNALVSLADKGLVEMRRGCGTFWIPQPQRERRELVVGINDFQDPRQKEIRKRLRSSLFGGMVRAAMKEGVEIKFKPVEFDPTSSESVDLENLQAAMEEVDCFFFSYPSCLSRNFIELLENISVPCIFYNPISPTETSNFLSPDYYGTAQNIGKVWARAGRKRIMMLQAPGTEFSTSCQLLLSGMLNGLGAESETFPEIIKVTVAQNINECGMTAFLDFVKRTGKVPDAVHCTADDLALGVLDAAQQLGINVPEAMSVIGGNGLSHGDEVDGLRPPLTATLQPFDQIGEGVIQLFQKRFGNQMRDVPGVYYPMKFIIGQTTPPIENSLFREIG